MPRLFHLLPDPEDWRYRPNYRRNDQPTDDRQTWHLSAVHWYAPDHRLGERCPPARNAHPVLRRPVESSLADLCMKRRSFGLWQKGPKSLRGPWSNLRSYRRRSIPAGHRHSCWWMEVPQWKVCQVTEMPCALSMQPLPLVLASETSKRLLLRQPMLSQ